MAPSNLGAVNVDIEPPEAAVVVGVAVNVEIEPPESVVGVAVVVGVVSNLGHPKFVASPNVCSLSNCSSSFEVVGEVFVGNSTAAHSIDDSCSHSSNLKVSPHEKMERFYNRPNLSYSVESDTSPLSTDATTNHHRKRGPRLNQGQRRHSSQVLLSHLVVRQI